MKRKLIDTFEFCDSNSVSSSNNRMYVQYCIYNAYRTGDTFLAPAMMVVSIMNYVKTMCKFNTNLSVMIPLKKWITNLFSHPRDAFQSWDSKASDWVSLSFRHFWIWPLWGLLTTTEHFESLRPENMLILANHLLHIHENWLNILNQSGFPTFQTCQRQGAWLQPQSAHLQRGCCIWLHHFAHVCDQLHHGMTHCSLVVDKGVRGRSVLLLACIWLQVPLCLPLKEPQKLDKKSLSTSTRSRVSLKGKRDVWHCRHLANEILSFYNCLLPAQAINQFSVIYWSTNESDQISHGTYR